jgi:urease accessory protein
MKPLYPLLQITDSLFPSGAFVHSYGLEGLLPDRVGAAVLRTTVESIWLGHLLRTDGLLGLAAYRAMVRGHVEQICELDRRLSAIKLPRELRDASATTGRSFLAEANAFLGSRRLADLCARVESAESPGNYAIAFHAAAAVAGAAETESLLAWGYQAAAQMTASLLRLGLLGHHAAVSLLGALREPIEQGVREVLRRDVGDVSGFAPRLEIASMRHERQYSRLFRS